MTFQYGIEHEVAFMRPDGSFADYTNTQFEDFAVIIDRLPVNESDYTQLRVGDAGIRYKRWYIEGLERFDNAGTMLYCTPKGIEIRTTIHPTLEGVVDELHQSFNKLYAESNAHGFTPVLTSYNPIRAPFRIDPPFNTYELQKFAVSSIEKLAIPMMTFGPDLNLSGSGFTDEQLISIAQKLVYATPYIIPFSFSSPFALNKTWEGLSKRTAYRSHYRPVVIVYLKEKQHVIKRNPILCKAARLEAEIGRIEFKAFDSCSDFDLYASLLTLLKGLILNTTLTERRDTPDAKALQISAREGFTNPTIYNTALKLVDLAADTLKDDPDVYRLALLKTMLNNREVPATHMIKELKDGKNLLDVLAGHYSLTFLSTASKTHINP